MITSIVKCSDTKPRIAGKGRGNAGLSTPLVLLLMVFSCQDEGAHPDNNAAFISFSTEGQTLPAYIDKLERLVRFEVNHDVDVTRLVPKFDIPDGYTVYANGVPQVSGSSPVDFSRPVTYELKDTDNRSTRWKASAVPLACKILIDASHDGGAWWAPQSTATGFNPDLPHQGQAFANLLREKGFQVDELGRETPLTEEMFFGYYIIIRAGGHQPYTATELAVYSKLIDRGMNLVFFTDHKKHDLTDELGDHLGLKFEGMAQGTIDKFTPHDITETLTSLNYMVGSALTNADQNSNIQVLGWLADDNHADLNINGVRDSNEPLAPPVMGILHYPNSRIFFMGDMNTFEFQPQPFVDNLIQWMGTCFVN